MHAMYVRARTCTYTSQVLKSLRLGSNVLGFAGIKAMAEMLEGNTALEELVLIDNSIGDAVGQPHLTEARFAAECDCVGR